ncbi:hypothetical protein GLAREA_06538 [Glarea lozoyensis ATCC 20868]|uniref:Uncharacterized protein n=1 Tax=Glarea lozoyensis (strain ATCC 20868 / MF5171) TaxID=1116229 RepID=S3D6V9_GLAL2|nr:uncharacterized protein GLAREA_06538 [Glarea lozoyensis ATCC 20868]EPE33525.1 hypothetical protein GLAREA_06538 [Glarea lozoyensis ATCC 20868]
MELTVNETSEQTPKTVIDAITAARLSCLPTNRLTVLTASLVQTFKTELKYNLIWSNGLYLQEVPKRLGYNDALDTSVSALTAAHLDIVLGRKTSVKALTEYSRALRTLKNVLNDPVKACASETLCAVMLLLLCQSFIGVRGAAYMGHVEGAAQILRARRYYNPADDFEAKLLLSLRGPVLFMGVLSDKIQFSRREWDTIVVNDLDGSTPEGKMMCCLAQLPVIRERKKKMLNGGNNDPDLLEETRTNYQNMMDVLEEFHSRKVEMQKTIAAGTVSTPYGRIMDAHYQRSYALGLSVSLVINFVAYAIEPDNSDLPLQAEHFVKEILSLCEGAEKFRPLGASYMLLCLMLAWAGTEDHPNKHSIEMELEKYLQDFPMGSLAELLPKMKLYAGYLRLLSTLSPDCY